MNASDVVVDVGCGNSPRMMVVRDFLVAMAAGDLDTVLGFLADDIVWNRVAGGTDSGKDGVAKWLARELADLPTAMTVETILSHGKFASASGTMTWDGTTWGFAEVYVFRSAAKTAPIVRIDSYLIRT